MEQSLQQLNSAQRMQIWSERIADCRSSGMSVRDWCREADLSAKTYYYWQKKPYHMLTEQPAFVEMSIVQCEKTPDIIASVQLGETRMNIYARSDEESLRTLMQALKSC